VCVSNTFLRKRSSTHLDSLTSRVVEFTSLSDTGTTRSQQEHLLYFRSRWSRLADWKGNLLVASSLVVAASIQEGVKHEFGVSWSTGGFRVELRGKVRTVLVGDTFVGAIVGVGEESLPAGFEGRRLNMVTVILRRDVAFSSLVIQDGLVLTTVAKRQLCGLTTGGQTHELVTQADTIDGFDLIFGASHYLYELSNRLFAHGWVTRSIRQEETVVVFQFIGKGVVPWHHRQFNATLNKLTNDIELHTTVNSNNLGGIALAVHLDFLGTDVRDQMMLIDILHLGEIRSRRIHINFNATFHGTVFSNLLGQHARVDVAEGRDALFLEPVSKTADCLPVRIMVTIILNQQASSMNLGGFKVCRQTKLVDGLAVGHTVVSHHGSRQGQNLTSVGRVGQVLRVSDHSSGENDLRNGKLRQDSNENDKRHDTSRICIAFASAAAEVSNSTFQGTVVIGSRESSTYFSLDRLVTPKRSSLDLGAVFQVQVSDSRRLLGVITR